MWLYMLGGFLVLLGLVGTVVGGGIFTIVLLPLGVIVLGSAFLFGAWGRAGQGAGGGDTEAHQGTNRPLPHNPSHGTGHVPTSPEALADARRVEQ
jgi:hypothetical protein